MADTNEDIEFTAEGIDGVEYMLSTVDNPFSPFTQFLEWFSFDNTRGYHSAALLARIAKTSNDLPDAVQDQAIQDAIDEIVRENVSGMHRKVTRKMFTELQTN